MIMYYACTTTSERLADCLFLQVIHQKISKSQIGLILKREGKWLWPHI